MFSFGVVFCSQKKYEQLLQEQKELAASRDNQRKMADEYRQRTKMLKQNMEQEQSSNKEKLQIDKGNISQNKSRLPAKTVKFPKVFLYVNILDLKSENNKTI